MSEDNQVILKIDNRFILGKKVGSGSFGEVYIGKTIKYTKIIKF